MSNSIYSSSRSGVEGPISTAPVRSTGVPIHQTVAPDIDPPSNTGALNALFARTRRSSEHVICPISDSALDATNLSPAFYCVHSLSGAGGTDFRDLATLMPAVRFFGIQAPPKKMQDPQFGASVKSIADYYAGALVKFQPKGPFLLGGWSAGAIIALQVAQNLRARGREVSLLAALDAAPENVAVGFRPWHPLYLLELARNVPGWIFHEELMTKRTLYSLIWRVSNKASAFGRKILPRKSGEEVVGSHPVEGFIDLSRYPLNQRSFMKRLYDALLEYAPKDYSGDVVVYEAKVKPLLRVPQVGKVWRKLAARAVIVSVEGTHLSLLREPYVNFLAKDLRTRIAHSMAAVCPATLPASTGSQPKRPLKLTGRMQAA